MDGDKEQSKVAIDPAQGGMTVRDDDVRLPGIVEQVSGVLATRSLHEKEDFRTLVSAAS
jgi:hypothetical protein